MINRARATTTKITDYNVGSVARTLLESPAQEIDQLYQMCLQGLLEGIAVSVYNSFSFPPLPPVAAWGLIRVSIAVQPTALLIPANSILTTSDGSRSYLATADVSFPSGSTFADVSVVCTEIGVAGNQPAGNTFSLLPSIPGFISAVNLAPFINGAAAETPSAQEVRFTAYLKGLARGTEVSISDALTSLAFLSDISGNVIERVTSVSMVEPYLTDPTQPPGLVQAYIHNGTTGTSSALVSQAQALVNGYIDPSGDLVSGYKAAGVRLLVNAATEIPLPIVGMLTVGITFDPIAVVAQVTAVLFTYVQGIGVGQPYIGAVADDLVMQVPGVLNWVVVTPVAYVSVALFDKLIPGTLTILGWLAARTVVTTTTTGVLAIPSTSTDLGIVSPISRDGGTASLTSTVHVAVLVGSGNSSDSALLNIGGLLGVGASGDSSAAAITTFIHLTANPTVSSDSASGQPPVSLSPPPSAVSGLQQAAVASNPTTTTLQMSWTPPATGNGSYTYNLAFSPDGSVSFSPPTTGIVGTTFVQTGLLPASLFAFRVRAVDSLGQMGPWTTTGPWSTAATNTPVSNETPAGGPLSTTGSTITNSIGETFVLTAQPAPNQQYNSLTVNGVLDSFIVVVEYMLYANHTVFIQTGNGAGVYGKLVSSERWVAFSGPAGIPLVPPVFDPSMPGALPTTVNGLALAGFNSNPGPNSIQMSWGAPTGTGPFLYLFAFKRDTDTTFSVPVVVDYLKLAQSYTEDGLSPSTNYDFEVAAIDAWNQQGPFLVSGPWPTAASVPAAPPPPPGAQNVLLPVLGATVPLHWVGSTASCAVYYDTSVYTDAQGAIMGANALATCEQAISGVKRIFSPTTYSVIAAATTNNAGSLVNFVLSYGRGYAAFHKLGQADVVVSLLGPLISDDYGWFMVAEISECFMGNLAGLATEDTYAIGEGLAQNLAELLFPNANLGVGQTWLDYYVLSTSGLPPPWGFVARPDFINNNVQSYAAAAVGPQYAINCNFHFFNWLRHKGYSFSEIFAAINGLVSPCSGRDVYNKLTGSTSVDPFPLFAADVSALYPVGANMNTAAFQAMFPGADLWQTPF